MKNSFAFFENKECEYYPCHEAAEINCLFCYCPLYTKDECPGSCKFIEVKGKLVKDCMDCTYPHDPANYGEIMKILSK